MLINLFADVWPGMAPDETFWVLSPEVPKPEGCFRLKVSIEVDWEALTLEVDRSLAVKKVEVER